MELGHPMEAVLELELELEAWALEQEAMEGQELPLGLVLVEELDQIAQADVLELLALPMMLRCPLLMLLLLPNSMVLAWVVEASVMVSPELNWGL